MLKIYFFVLVGVAVGDSVILFFFFEVCIYFLWCLGYVWNFSFDVFFF
jgi:hypothetical protein